MTTEDFVGNRSSHGANFQRRFFSFTIINFTKSIYYLTSGWPASWVRIPAGLVEGGEGWTGDTSHVGGRCGRSSSHRHDSEHNCLWMLSTKWYIPRFQLPHEYGQTVDITGRGGSLSSQELGCLVPRCSY